MPRPKKQSGGSELWVDDVNKMYDKYGMFDWVKMNKDNKSLMVNFLKHRIDHITEEKKELDDALATENAEEIVDAMIDICVLSIGTLQLFGVDAKKAWDEVLKANIAKERGIKSTRPNPFGLPDLIKPEGWKGPDHSDNHGLFTSLFEKSKIPDTSYKADKPDVDDLARVTQSLSKLTRSPPASNSGRRPIVPNPMGTPQSKRTRLTTLEGSAPERKMGGKRKPAAKK
jgi:hypothetical protein